LRHPERLAGIMALSCFLPLPEALESEASAANREAPIFMAHGAHDPLIPLARAVQARDALTALGYRVEWRQYPMPHSVCDAEVLDIADWLRRILAG
jgi:phospholipase/carboxylesterase